jgi:hypothetical protein
MSLRPTQFAEMTYEAMCSVFYNLEWVRFLGERPSPVDGSDEAFFRFSEDPTQEHVSPRVNPKVLMVAVGYDTEDIVRVHAEWLNFSGGEVIKGGQTLHIVANPDLRESTERASEAAAVRVLEIWSDILQQSGVAGPLERVAPESEAGDPDDPADMAASDEEVGRE